MEPPVPPKPRKLTCLDPSISKTDLLMNVGLGRMADQYVHLLHSITLRSLRAVFPRFEMIDLCKFMDLCPDSVVPH